MTPTRKQDEGFALAMVVFMLFAAAVAGVTGYQMVSAEASLADGNQNQSEALETAHGGLRRYVGEHIGIPGADSFKTFQNSGALTLKAVVTPKKVAKLNDSTDLYLLTSVGTVTDSRYPNSPATRTAYQYAQLNRRPVKRRAAFWSIENNLQMQNPSGSGLDGTENALDVKTGCPAGDTLNLTSVYGAIHTGTISGANAGSVLGSPRSDTSLVTNANVLSAEAVRWSVLKDATFPIPYDGTWPNFAAIPSDSFPVIRVSGNYTLDRDGRGALIVTGTFTQNGVNTWKGIILAGAVTNTSLTKGNGNPVSVQGMVLTGLNGTPNGNPLQIQRFDVKMYACYVRKANLALAYLSPINRSTWTY
jgi:hypothetical protein